MMGDHLRRRVWIEAESHLPGHFSDSEAQTNSDLPGLTPLDQATQARKTTQPWIGQEYRCFRRLRTYEKSRRTRGQKKPCQKSTDHLTPLKTKMDKQRTQLNSHAVEQMPDGEGRKQRARRRGERREGRGAGAAILSLSVASPIRCTHKNGGATDSQRSRTTCAFPVHASNAPSISTGRLNSVFGSSPSGKSQ